MLFSFVLLQYRTYPSSSGVSSYDSSSLSVSLYRFVFLIACFMFFIWFIRYLLRFKSIYELHVSYSRGQLLHVHSTARLTQFTRDYIQSILRKKQILIPVKMNQIQLYASLQLSKGIKLRKQSSHVQQTQESSMKTSVFFTLEACAAESINELNNNNTNNTIITATTSLPLRVDAYIGVRRKDLSALLRPSTSSSSSSSPQSPATKAAMAAASSMISSGQLQASHSLSAIELAALSHPSSSTAPSTRSFASISLFSESSRLGPIVSLCTDSSEVSSSTSPSSTFSLALDRKLLLQSLNEIEERVPLLLVVYAANSPLIQFTVIESAETTATQQQQQPRGEEKENNQTLSASDSPAATMSDVPLSSNSSSSLPTQSINNNNNNAAALSSSLPSDSESDVSSPPLSPHSSSTSPDLSFSSLRLSSQYVYNSSTRLSVKLEELYGISEKSSGTSGDEENLCIVCFSEVKNIILLPCRHVCLCEECYKNVRKCPIGRCEILEYCKFRLTKKEQETSELRRKKRRGSRSNNSSITMTEEVRILE